jgi:hypothetical protein
LFVCMIFAAFSCGFDHDSWRRQVQELSGCQTSINWGLNGFVIMRSLEIRYSRPKSRSCCLSKSMKGSKQASPKLSCDIRVGLAKVKDQTSRSEVEPVLPQEFKAGTSLC